MDLQETQYLLTTFLKRHFLSLSKRYNSWYAGY